MRQQFSNLERFYHIVVRAEIEAVDAVVNAVPRGNNDNRKLAAKRTKPAQAASPSAKRRSFASERRFGCEFGNHGVQWRLR
jgi:hypothetical protein